MTQSRIILLDWYQFDIEIQGGPKVTMRGIVSLVDGLKSQNLIEKWFYLYEKSTIHGLFTDLQSKGLINEVFHPTYGRGNYSYHITALAKAILDLTKIDGSSK